MPAWFGAFSPPRSCFDEQQVRGDLEAALLLRDQCKLQASLCAQAIVLRIRFGVDDRQGGRLRSQLALRIAAGPRGARLARLGPLTTPGLRDDELFELGELCDFISFNSLSQLRRSSGPLQKPGQIGLRVNPQLSLVADDRYNPCRPLSKLGVPLDYLARRWDREPELFERVSGLLFHNNCDSTSFEPLHRTVTHVESVLAEKLAGLSWINLGGGYLLDEPEAVDLLARSGRAAPVALWPLRLHRARRRAGSQGGLSGRVGDRHVPLPAAPQPQCSIPP